jgi:calcineurin-like phosphoesterase family protein
MNNVWIVSDTHFHHDKIINHCYRPKNHEELQFNHLKRLKENDILLHLGDVSFSKIEEAHEKYIKPLKCKKWLVLGNHDTKSVSWYVKHGWDFVARDFTTLFMGKLIIFSHRPLKVGGNIINVHGHLHNLERDILKAYPDEYLEERDRHILISPEYNRYRPVKLKTILGKKHGIT